MPPTTKAIRNRRAFTLLELLVVVLIIGIIAMIVAPRVSVTTSTAEDAVQSHHLTQLNDLVELYHMDNESWPTALTDLSAYLPDGVPTPPTGGSYTINGTSHRVEHTP